MKWILMVLIIAGVVFAHGGGDCLANSFSIQMTAYLPEIPGVTVPLIEEEEIALAPRSEEQPAEAAAPVVPEELPIQQEITQKVIDTTGQYQMFILRTYYVK